MPQSLGHFFYLKIHRPQRDVVNALRALDVQDHPALAPCMASSLIKSDISRGLRVMLTLVEEGVRAFAVHEHCAAFIYIADIAAP